MVFYVICSTIYNASAYTHRFFLKFSKLLSIVLILNSPSYFLKMIPFEDHAYDPRSYDILLTDIDTNDIHEAIPRKLKIEYLSDPPKEFDGNIDGIVYGPNLRLFCATTLKIKDKIKIITFLVVTGSPMTYISEEVLLAFGIEIDDPVNDYMNVKINSKTTRIMMSHSYFKEVSVMGMSFLNANNVGMHVYCGSGIFYLNFDQEWDKMNQSIAHNPPPHYLQTI